MAHQDRQAGVELTSTTEVLRSIENHAIYAGLAALRSWRERDGEAESEADTNLVSEIYAAMRSSELNYRSSRRTETED